MSTTLAWTTDTDGRNVAALPDGREICVRWDDMDPSSQGWWGRALVESGLPAVELDSIEAERDERDWAIQQAEAELEAVGLLRAGADQE